MPRFHIKKSKLFFWTILIGGLLLIGSVIGLRTMYNQNLLAAGPSEQNQLVTIKSGATVKEIAELLHGQGIIREAWAFEWYVRNQGLRDKLQAGSFYVRQNQSVPVITDILTNGRVATDLVTILPAKRIDQIRQGLINSGWTAEQVDAALDPKLYVNHPALVDKPPADNLEGYLYPDSFQKTSVTLPGDIVKASLDEMQKYLTPEVRAGIVQQGLTVHQGIIIGSIIEQEVSKLADKPQVAQVFLKRYKIGMMLGSDPTALYGAILAGAELSVRYDSPYNTRLKTGLPPGPIGNVSQSSLGALIKPAGTDFLYFVAGDDGVTYFSKTVEEHEALTKQHCIKLCSLF